MKSKQILFALGALSLSTSVIAAVLTNASEEKQNTKACQENAKNCKAINGGAGYGVTYIRTKHTTDNPLLMEQAKRLCEYSKLKSKGAGEFTILGPKHELGVRTQEEYYSHDGRYVAKYVKGHMLLPITACKSSIEPYVENDFTNHVDLVNYKYKSVKTKKEKWHKTKLLDIDEASLGVPGLEGKMGLSGGAEMGKDMVAKVPCTVSKMKNAQFETTVCTWKKDPANSHAKLPLRLTLQSETNWSNGIVNTGIAEEVDFNKYVERSLLLPPQNILERKFPVDEMSFAEDE